MDLTVLSVEIIAIYANIDDRLFECRVENSRTVYEDEVEAACATFLTSR